VVTDTAAVEVDEVVNLDIFTEFHIRGYLFHDLFTTEARRSQRIFFSHRLTQTDTDIFFKLADSPLLELLARQS
jgi:hypothetical protein